MARRPRQIQRVFAFGIVLFANEHFTLPAFLLSISCCLFVRSHV
jgi:hypothetical protein